MRLRTGLYAYTASPEIAVLMQNSNPHRWDRFYYTAHLAHLLLLSLQDIHDCYLDLFQTHLHFVSNNTTGLTYQVSFQNSSNIINNPFL